MENKMIYVKLSNSKVVQKQPYSQTGFIEAPGWVVCGMVWDGETYVMPHKTEEQLKISKIEEIEEALYHLDILSLRSTRAILSGTDIEDDHTVITSIEAQTILLREELTALHQEVPQE